MEKIASVETFVVLGVPQKNKNSSEFYVVQFMQEKNMWKWQELSE